MKHSMKIFRTALIGTSLLLSACGFVGTKYPRPGMETPGDFGIPMGTGLANQQVWWGSFQDPTLDALLSEAATNNQDLLIAVARIDEARATLQTTSASRFPAIDMTIAGDKTRTSQNAGKLADGVAPIAKNIQVGINASYEVDLWGKLNYANQAARARLLSQEANRGIVFNALCSDVAQTYFGALASDAQSELAKATLATRAENLRLQKRRFSAGSIGELDLHQAESEAAAAEISLAQAEQAREVMESALALLLGRSPAEIAKPHFVRGKHIDDLYRSLVLPANLSSDLLNRRPDIVAAEQLLVAAHADVNQARSLYFPSLILTTGLGYESNALRDLFRPSSLLWSVAGSLTQPIFRGGAIDAVVSGAQAREAQAIAQYKQNVQSAFRDVHDALANLSAYQRIALSMEQRLTALKDTSRLAELRYKNGYSSYLEVLNAQRDLLQAQSSLIENKRAHLTGVASLYRAVGGGWKMPDAQALNSQRKSAGVL